MTYADPPYIGKAHFYPENTEVDHFELIRDLVAQFPDGWALSCISPTLQQILAICPPAVRVAAWVKPFCAFKANVTVAYAWEPVIFRGGRKRSRTEPTVRDWVSASITLKKGLVGAKPEAFCLWLLDVLNVQEGDEIVDLYPGTGSMTAALEKASRPDAAGGMRTVNERSTREGFHMSTGYSWGPPWHMGECGWCAVGRLVYKICGEPATLYSAYYGRRPK